MLHLPAPASNIIQEYRDLLKPRINAAIAVSDLKPAARTFLTSIKLEEIITDTPDKLIAHHNRLIPLLGKNFTLSDYNNFLTAKRTKFSQRSERQKQLINRYKPKILELENIFNYNQFIANHKKTSYWLAKTLNRNTCTYCNRLYTNTVIEKDPATGRINNSSRIMRPQFDHWFSKEFYPVLALSFYNLIPSCAICNSSIKGTSKLKLATHLHPYIIDTQETFSFNYDFDSSGNPKVLINVSANSKMANTLNVFKIASVYNAHSQYELQDILDLSAKYSEDYLDVLLNKTFDSLKVSRQEVYRMIFGIEDDEKEFHKRPFSKFKKDILTQLKVI